MRTIRADVRRRSRRGRHANVSRRSRTAVTLAVPDFVGNFAFNTLGDLLLEPRCSLLFVEFATGTTLEIAAQADITWEASTLASISGAQRLVRFHVTRARRMEGALPLRWSPIQSDAASTTG